MPVQTKAIFEFGPFRLDPAERLLMCKEAPVPLPPKAFDALVVMVGNRGRLLGKDELLKAVWPDSFVEESNLAQHVSILRKALREGDDSLQYIETVPRHGYRFVAEVREEAHAAPAVPVPRGSSPDPPAAAPPAAAPPINPRRRLPALAGVIAALALAVLIAALTMWNRQRGAGPEPLRSLAVLPLQNLSGDPAQDYFSDGMTEALITDLAKIPGLKVISRTSIMQYRDSHKQLPSIARELGVDGIVEGSVLRSGDRVRITAQLVRGATDQHIWAESYERNVSDLLALQDEVSRSIATQIRKEIAPVVSHRPLTSAAADPQAREDYLKGRYFWNLRNEAGYRKAIDHFQSAVTVDPNYAQAYAGLADAYALLGSLPDSTIRDAAMPKAREMALTALKLDDTLADAHASLAFVEMHYEWKFQDAEREFKRAIDLDPNYSTAHHWYAYDLAAMDRMDEAVAEIKRARDTDPISAIINTDVAEMLYWARRYDEAMQQARVTIELEPNFAHAHRVLERIYDEKQMYPEAIAEGERAVALSGDDIWMLLDLATTYALAGHMSDMRDCLKRASQLTPGGGPPATGTTSELYATLGDFDRAFQVMESQFRRREGGLILLNADPRFDGLKSDLRFQQLLQRVGLPQHPL
jgi:TolB-like protein/DNA-binding winged helix-turn-helix (wHTH) protein/Tfp pilus assembly protein PilF